jgi:aspartate-semialdehyde dehydrogenase
MARRFDVAVLGAESAIGEALLQLIQERKFPAGEISALAIKPEAGLVLPYAGNELEVEDAERFDFGQVQLAFLADSDERLIAQAERAADRGCVVVDASGLAWQDPAIPVVVPELNAAALANFNERGIVASPSRLTVALALALAPLHALAGLTRLTVTAMLPASDSGRAGLEDLARETTALLNARHYQRLHFPQQIAFNLLGQSGVAEGDGYTEAEARVADELAALLQVADLSVSATLVQAPVFYGHAISLEAEFLRPITVDAAAAALRASPALDLIETLSPEDCPSPVVDAMHSDAIRLGRLRLSRGRTQALTLWLTADNIRRGGALNALANAEILARDYL